MQRDQKSKPRSHGVYDILYIVQFRELPQAGQKAATRYQQKRFCFCPHNPIHHLVRRKCVPQAFADPCSFATSASLSQVKMNVRVWQVTLSVVLAGILVATAVRASSGNDCCTAIVRGLHGFVCALWFGTAAWGAIFQGKLILPRFLPMLHSDCTAVSPSTIHSPG